MSSVAEKMRKLRERRAKENSGKKTFSNLRDIYYDFEMGDNRLRLCGEFLEVRTHFLAPAPKRGDRGLCNGDAFKGDYNEKLQMVVNCPDWDLEKEEHKGTTLCPICKLNKIANAIVSDNPDEEEKKFFTNLRSQCRARSALKWNVIDRNNPFITKKDGENEEQVLGYKIATVGMEAYDDIEGIFEQTGMDISDDEEGVDIIISKTKGKMRIEYSAKAAMDTSVKPPTVAMTPLTSEELAAERHRLLERCGKQTDVQKVIDALHPDLLEILELNDDEEEASSPAKEEEAPAPAKEEKAPAKEEKAPAKEEKSPEPEPVVETVVDNVDEDDDDPLAGTTQKKS